MIGGTYSLAEMLQSAEVRAAIRKAAERVSCNHAAERYEGDVPNSYHAFVEEEAYEAMADALRNLDVADLEDYADDRRLDEACSAQLERARAF